MCFFANLNIKQRLLYDEVINLTCIYKGLILANNAKARLYVCICAFICFD